MDLNWIKYKLSLLFYDFHMIKLDIEYRIMDIEHMSKYYESVRDMIASQDLLYMIKIVDSNIEKLNKLQDNIKDLLRKLEVFKKELIYVRKQLEKNG